MKPITEQEHKELIERLTREISDHNEFLSDSFIDPMVKKDLMLDKNIYEIALASLTADIYTWFGSISLNTYWDQDGDDSRFPLYTAPPVPVIKLPEDGFTGGRWCPEDREGYANGVSDCIEEMERLYNIK